MSQSFLVLLASSCTVSFGLTPIKLARLPVIPWKSSGPLSVEPDLFDEFWRDRQRLHDVIVTLVRSGIEQEDFVECDAELAALLIVSVDEGIEKQIVTRRSMPQIAVTRSHIQATIPKS